MALNSNENISPQVSVVIPFFNSSSTIVRAVESVLAQTYPILEILIVDDGSKTQHFHAVEDLIQIDCRIRVIRFPHNQGPASARNAGWNAARGEWVAFLDSDDAWHPRKIEIQIQVASIYKNDIALVGARTATIKSEDSPIRDIDMNLLSHKKVSTWDLIKKNRFATPTVMVRADLSARFTEGRRYSEDYELWLRLSTSGFLLIHIDFPLALLFKEHYGEAGLSSNMAGMAWGELKTYQLLLNQGKLGLMQYSGAIVISVIKTLRRYLIVLFRKVRG